MRKKTLLVITVMMLLLLQSVAQETFPVAGIRDERMNLYAFRNATIIADHKTRIDKANLLIKDGIILEIGKDIEIPEEAIEIDLTGKFIYPSLIEIYSNYGLPENKVSGSNGRGFQMSRPQFESKTPGAFNWNEAIKSSYSAGEEFQVNSKEASSFREIGFGVALTFKPDGIARGTSALVALSEDRPNKVILNERIAAHYSFNKGSSRQSYPSSLMGSIALLRQTYLDADWYASANDRSFQDLSLESWNANQELPQIFEAGDKYSILRADKVVDEFGIQYIIAGDGREYQILEDIRETGAPLIIPVNFPPAMDVSDRNLFEEKTIIYENWILGKKYVLTDMTLPDISGKYILTAGDAGEYEIKITGKPGKYSLEISIDDSTRIKPKLKTDGKWVSFSFETGKKEKKTGVLRFTGWVKKKKIQRQVQFPDGTWGNWIAEYKEEAGSRETPKKTETSQEMEGNIISPFVAYGSEELPEPTDVLFRNATVWTNETDGILTGTDVLVKNGKISAIGKNLPQEDITVIDATGKHLTSGVIDEHSHIACSGGLNEGSHAITSEVRIGDVINPDDISIYRQLAGGVTAAHILHGSANPIGGQSCIIKHRWGENAEGLKVKGTIGFLKHALGENVKQSRTPQYLAIRYPQSRMGVEQIIKDSYTRSKEYLDKWDRYNKLNPKDKTYTPRPRRDLQLEAIGEVLRKKSYITCHTYVQSETNMIMKLADEFGIKAHTLIHNTEGYKIADKMRKHGAAGSIFSDWWAFKYEVYHAIPYNAALHLDQGVITCIHSDNAELSRRLNQEAAKAVKYGGVSEEEAWKLVTLNPARILHLDNRMGSIKPGKDADLVLWSDNPLSIYARAEKTMVDGIIYFDMDRDVKLQQYIQKERSRLLKKMMAAGNDKPSFSGTRTNQQFLWDDEEVIDIFNETDINELNR